MRSPDRDATHAALRLSPSSDEVSAIVIDIGSTCTKSGFAGEDCPKFVVPSSVGILGGEEAGAKAEYRVGTNALCHRVDGMRISSPLSDGIVQDWDACEAILEHTFKSCLACVPSEHPVLFTEPSHNTPAAREKLCELAFEKFDVPAAFLSKNAVLAAFASGRSPHSHLPSTAMPITPTHTAPNMLARMIVAVRCLSAPAGPWSQSAATSTGKSTSSMEKPR